MIEKQAVSVKPDIEQLRKAARKYKDKLMMRPIYTVDAPRKTKLCIDIAEVISNNFEGWELKFNEPDFMADCSSLEQGLRSISVYRNKRFLGHRLIAPEASVEKVLFEIAGVFLVAMEKVKEAEKKS